MGVEQGRPGHRRQPLGGAHGGRSARPASADRQRPGPTGRGGGAEDSPGTVGGAGAGLVASASTGGRAAEPALGSKSPRDSRLSLGGEELDDSGSHRLGG